MAQAQQDFIDRALARPQRRPALRHAAAGGDPGVHRREGNRHCAKRAPPRRRRSSSTACAWACGCNPIPPSSTACTKGYPLGRGIRLERAGRRHALQHLCDRAACRRVPSPIRARMRWRQVINPPETKDLYFVADGLGPQRLCADPGRTWPQCRRPFVPWNGARPWRRASSRIDTDSIAKSIPSLPGRAPTTRPWVNGRDVARRREQVLRLSGVG